MSPSALAFRSDPPAAGPRPVEPERPEETLDPADWDELRRLAHTMVDDVFWFLETVRERPCWRPFPDENKRRLAVPPPRAGEGAEAVYREFRDTILPYPYGNVHPRHWGWVNGTGSAVAALADFLASAMNPNVASFDHAAPVVEAQVIAWMRELMGMPEASEGILVSGGSKANFVGLAAARSATAGFDVREAGLAGGPQLAVYASTETHSSVQKAVELLGLGRAGYRRVAVGDDFTVDVAAMRRAIRDDRARGLRPIAIVGNAGTVNSGAVDDLAALADLAAEEGLWLHVDGAFGAWAAISPRLRPVIAGMERADSLAFDLHKWMYLPYDVACVLVRTPGALERAFAVVPDYLQPLRAGVAGRGTAWNDRGVQLSRSFRALKIWMSFKAEGIDKLARLVDQNADQAARLAALVDAHPRLERLAPVPLNVVAFRWADPERPDLDLDALDAELLVRLQESGVAVVSSTRLRGRFCFRAAIVNHRTRRSDLDVLVDSVVRIGDELAAGG